MSNQELTSPYISRSNSLVTTTMEALPKEGVSPLVLQPKKDAWVDSESKNKEQPVDEWIKAHVRPVLEKAQPTRALQSHPMNTTEQSFLESTVLNMRDNLMSNTAVMSLLEQPVSIFDSNELIESPDIDLDIQATLNKELEEFLEQIREIRDGKEPPVPTNLTKELTVHIEKQKNAVEQALSELDRELTIESVTNVPLLKDEEIPAEVSEDLNVPEETIIHEETKMPENIDAHKSEVLETTREEIEHIPSLDIIQPRKNPSPIPSSDSLMGPATPESLTEEAVPHNLKDIPIKKMNMYDILDLHPDEKIRKAARQMKRLDERLKMVMKKEREVKKQREILNKQLLLYSSSQTLINQTGIQEDIKDDITIVSDLESSVTPIFPTQIDEMDDAMSSCSTFPPINSSRPSMTATPKGKTPSKRGGAKMTSRTHREDGCSSSAKRTSNTESPLNRCKNEATVSGKNFLIRNKELASNAGDVIAMTEAEKERLMVLLNEDEADAEPPADKDKAVSIFSEGGFTVPPEDETRLAEIERALISEEAECMSVCSFHSNNTRVSAGSKVMSELQKLHQISEGDELGEVTLRNLRSDQLEHQKIQIIDEMISRYSSEEHGPPPVSEQDLRELLSEIRKSIPGPQTPTPEYLE